MNAKTEKYFNHKNGGYFMAIIEEMNDLLSQVQEKYDQVCMQRDHLQKRLMEFNAEEEIQKAKERTLVRDCILNEFQQRKTPFFI